MNQVRKKPPFARRIVCGGISSVMAVAFAALSVWALALGGCETGVGGGGERRGQVNIRLVPPSETLASADSVSRTVVPDSLSGKFFRVTFTPPEGSTEKPVVVEADNVNFRAKLAVGVWAIAAEGWASKPEKDENGDIKDPPMMRGDGTVTVSANGVTDAEVVMFPVAAADASGTLSYEIAVPGGTDYALLRIYPLPLTDTTRSPLTIDLFAKNPAGATLLTGEAALGTGFWQTALDLSMKTEGAVKTLRTRDVVHIYDGEVSKAVYSFAEADFSETETFDSIEAMAAYLNDPHLPDNRPDTPYMIALTDVDLSVKANMDKIFALTKYVSLDLRGCVGKSIPSYEPADPFLIDRDKICAIFLPDTVKTIGDYAFYSMRNLRSVSLPAKLESIGIRAFSGTVSKDDITPSGDPISSIELPKTLTSIGNYAFRSCASLAEADLSGLTLTSMGTNIFNGCGSLKTVTLPDTLPDNRLPNGTFRNCTALESVGSLPQNLETIDNGAFQECAVLTLEAIPQSVKTIVANAFSGCARIAPDLSLLPNLETIGSNAFSNCAGIYRLRLPEGLISIGKGGNGSFINCANLELVELAGEALIDMIDYGTFQSSLSVKFRIGSGEAKPYLVKGGETLVAWPGADGNLTVPEGVSEITQDCFRMNTKITGVNFPDSVESIGYESFYLCENLTAINFSAASNLKTIESHAFGACTKLESLVLPKSVTEIGSSSFQSAGIVSAGLSASVIAALPQSVFASCTSLGSASLPESLASIEGGAFSGCTKLISLTCEATEAPTVAPGAFSGVDPEMFVQVPSNAVDKYKADPVWGAFNVRAK